MIQDNSGWFLLEEIPNAYPFLLAGTFKRMTAEFKEMGLPIHMNLLYKDHTLYLYFIKDEMLRTGEALFNMALEDPTFLKKVSKKNKKAQSSMFKFNDVLLAMDVSSLDTKGLKSLYDKYALTFEKAIVAGWIDNVIEFDKEYFSSYLRKYLDEKGKAISKSGAELFSLFSTPNKLTFGAKQEKALLKIVDFIQKDTTHIELFTNSTEAILEKISNCTDYQQLNLLLDEHTKKYCWYFNMYKGPAWQKSDFVNQIKLILSQKTIKDTIKETKKEISNSELKSRLIIGLGIDKKHVELLKIAEEIVFNKDLRKHSIYNSCYVASKLFDEIGSRTSLTTHHARSILPWEMGSVLIDNAIPYLDAREQGFLMQFYDGMSTEVLGNKALEFFEAVKNSSKVEEHDTLKGSCAFPGKVKGIVKIVNLPSDMEKVNDGDILVSHQTNPDLLSAMKKAVAFVTDIGGITCHAAIVSREMKKPCVVGTKIASKVFKDGDLVEVDANEATIRKIDKPK